MDAGETAAESAVRELREETGYVGEASEISPVMFNGKSTSMMSHNKMNRQLLILYIWNRPWLLQYEPQHGACQCGHVSTGKPESEA